VPSLRLIHAVRHILDTPHIARANDSLIFFNQCFAKLANGHLDEEQVMQYLAHRPGLASPFVIALGLGEPVDASEEMLPVGIGEEHGLV
jgi:hypothetical protein